MNPETTRPETQISSKAPFMGAIVFLGLMFWVYQSDIYAAAEAWYLRIITMVTFGLLAVASTIRGVYLHRTGQKTIAPPRTSHLVWGVVSVVLIGVIGAAVMYFQASSFK